jgi:hypothetical protein
MRIGNTTAELRRGVIAGFVVGLIAYLFCALMFIFYERLPTARLIPLTFIVFVPPLCITLGIAPTLVFSIHIKDDWVEHRIFNTWVTSRARASTFIFMETQASFPAVLVFANGTKIRLLGGTLTILRDLESELERIKKDATKAVSPNGS